MRANAASAPMAVKKNAARLYSPLAGAHAPAMPNATPAHPNCSTNLFPASARWAGKSVSGTLRSAPRNGAAVK